MNKKDEPKEFDLRATDKYECPYCGRRLNISRTFRLKDPVVCSDCERSQALEHWVKVKPKEGA